MDTLWEAQQARFCRKLIHLAAHRISRLFDLQDAVVDAPDQPAGFTGFRQHISGWANVAVSIGDVLELCVVGERYRHAHLVSGVLNQGLAVYSPGITDGNVGVTDFNAVIHQLDLC